MKSPYTTDLGWPRRVRDERGRFIKGGIETARRWCDEHGHDYAYYDDLVNPNLTGPITFVDGSTGSMTFRWPPAWVCWTCAKKVDKLSGVDSDDPLEHERVRAERRASRLGFPLPPFGVTR